jgi:hypothetical protein
MPTNASQIFDFLDKGLPFSIERHEIADSNFCALRRSLLSIVVGLHEDYTIETEEISDRLRMHLSEWLTVPVPFDDSMLRAVQTFGDPSSVEDRWGRDIRISYDAAVQAAGNLAQYESLLLTKVRAMIREFTNKGKTFKIYCHRRAQPFFEQLAPLDAPLSEGTFLHSVRDYGYAEVFDILIKVGPLRSRGWGSAPDALISAPRFCTLVQIVWSGCSDEPGFGYDPVASRAESGSALANGSVAGYTTLDHRISWTKRTTRSGDDIGTVIGREIDVDEFQIFGELSHTRENRRATLVEIDGEQGILYPLHCQVLCFDPTPQVDEPIGHRFPGETLVQGMFVILPIYSDPDFGGSEARRGLYSQAWKTRLAAMYRSDPQGFTTRLWSDGIHLRDLHACVERWSGSLSDVLPAPGQSKHFQLLIKALGVDWNANDSLRMKGIPWWECAWNEIRHARGEAIQTGRNEHELVDEELRSILKGLLADIRSLSAMHDAYYLPIPADRSLRGIFRFYKVCSVEEGFLAPETELRVVRELNTIQQWRV